MFLVSSYIVVFIVCGYCEGITIWHSAVVIVTVYSLLSLFGGTKLSLLLTWTVTMV